MPTTRHANERLTSTDPAYTASRQWIMAALVGVTFGVTLLTTYGMQASLTQYTALAAIGIGVVGVLLLAPWKQTRQVMEQRRQLRAMTEALRRAVRDGRPIPKNALCIDRDDDLGDLSRAIAHISRQNVQARVESRNLQQHMHDEIARSASEATAKWQRQALHDPLTGLPSRRHFEQYIADVIGRSGQSGAPIGLMVIHVDHLQTINKTLGSDVRDQCLAYLAQLLSFGGRRGDLAVRFDTDMFILVMDHCTADKLLAAADQLALSYLQMTWDHAHVPRPTLRIETTVIHTVDQQRSARISA